MATETVLIVDNSPAFLQFMEAALAPSAYHILTADSVVAALNLVRSNPHIDLVISEDVLPETSGAELIENVKRSCPAAAVMLITTDAAEPSVPSIPYIVQPFTAQTFLNRVNEALARNEQAILALHNAAEQNSNALQQIAVQASALQDAMRGSREARWRSRMQSRSNRPTILLADDDAISRYAVAHHLWKEGFTVLDASSYIEASELWREYAGHIDIILAALRGLEGLALAEVVEDDCPEEAIVFITDGDTDLSYPALRRPFELEDLGAAIRRILAEGIAAGYSIR